MNVFEFFDKIYCINLDIRQDRWEKAKEQFSKFGIEGRVERISGFVLDDSESVDSGERSCMISHIKCLKDAKEKNYKNFLILEDDVFFSNKFSEKISLALKELPDDWDMLYLGFCPKDINSKFSKYSDNLFKLESDCFCTHSIAYNQKFLNILFNNFDNFIKERAYDIMLSTFFHKEFNCYAINPPIVHQQLKLNSNVNHDRNNYDWSLMIYNKIAEEKGFNKIDDQCRNLVFTSCGDKNLFFDRWVKPYRNYDLAIAHYGNKKELLNLYKNVSVFAEKMVGSKFQNFYKFYRDYNYIFSNYDYIFIIDDDITLSSDDINKMFDIAKEKNLGICQPSFSNTGKISHNINRNIKGIKLAYTNFVEVNCPLFSKEYLVNLMNVYDESLVGWGVDYLYIQANGLYNKRSYAVVHDVVCTNPIAPEEERELKKTVNYNNREKLWKRYCYLNKTLPEFEHIVYDTEYS